MGIWDFSLFCFLSKHAGEGDGELESSLQADKGNLWAKTKKSEFNYILFIVTASGAQAELGRDCRAGDHLPFFLPGLLAPSRYRIKRQLSIYSGRKRLIHLL